MYQIVKIKDILGDNLEQINSNMNFSWIIIGDFNTIMHAHEKRGGVSFPSKKLEILNKFLLKTGLCEPTIFENKFTWK